MSKFLLLSLKKYDIEINSSIYLGDFFIMERLDLYKIYIINFESGMWALKSVWLQINMFTYVWTLTGRKNNTLFSL